MTNLNKKLKSKIINYMESDKENQITKKDWNDISLDENLSIKFIIKFKSFVNWDIISKNHIISNEFIKSFYDNINWKLISSRSSYNNDELKILNKYKNKLYWNLILNINTPLWFIEDNLKYTWHRLNNILTNDEILKLSFKYPLYYWEDIYNLNEDDIYKLQLIRLKSYKINNDNRISFIDFYDNNLGLHKRLYANQDIKIHDNMIKRGTFGGVIINSKINNSWIDYDSNVKNSILDNSYICKSKIENSIMINSYIEKDCKNRYINNEYLFRKRERRITNEKRNKN